jgi:hypothetical protein
MTGTIVYTIMLLLILFLKLLMGSLDTDEKKKRFLFMSAMLIIFVVGSRFAPLNRGTDMYNYYNYYAFAGRVPFNELYFRDVGYNYLTWFLTRIVPWPQFVMYFVAAVTTWLTLRFIYLNCKDVFLGLLLFLSMGTFLFYLRGFRQALAMSLCLVAFEYVKEKKLIKFIVVTLIAVSMHRSAVVFLPFYFLGNRKAKAWNNIVTLVGFIAMIFFLQDVLDFGNDLLEKSYAMRNPSQSIIGPIINITVFLRGNHTWVVTSPLRKRRQRKQKHSGHDADAYHRIVHICAALSVFGDGKDLFLFFARNSSFAAGINSRNEERI